MDGFGKFLNGAKKTSQSVGQKAGSLIEIRETEEKINAVLRKIGEIVYTSVKENTLEPNEEILQHCSVIDELEEKKSELREKAAFLKGEKVCKNCGQTNPSVSVFCSSCGKEL
jgi:hypothetical protein